MKRILFLSIIFSFVLEGCIFSNSNGDKEPNYVETTPDKVLPFKIRREKINARLSRVHLGNVRCLYRGIWGDKLAYTVIGRVEKRWKACYLDLNSLEEHIVPNEPGSYSAYGIYEDKILIAKEIKITKNKEWLWVFYLYDLKTGRKEWLFNKSINDEIPIARFYGDKIAYFIGQSRARSSNDKRNEWDLMIYDINKREKKKITTVDLARVYMEIVPLGIGLTSNMVAYMDNDKEHFRTNAKDPDLYVEEIKDYVSHASTYIGYYRFDDNKFYRVPMFGVGHPEASGDYILFDRINKDASKELNVYNVKIQQIISIVHKKFRYSFNDYDINDNRLVWVDPDTDEIHLYNLKNGSDKVLYKYKSAGSLFGVFGIAVSKKWLSIGVEYEDETVIDVYKLDEE